MMYDSSHAFFYIKQISEMLGQMSGATSSRQNKQKFIQGVPGGMCQTSGECSLGQTIPI